jgi:hypothetical protein
MFYVLQLSRLTTPTNLISLPLQVMFTVIALSLASSHHGDFESKIINHSRAHFTRRRGLFSKYFEPSEYSSDYTRYAAS